MWNKASGKPIFAKQTFFCLEKKMDQNTLVLWTIVHLFLMPALSKSKTLKIKWTSHLHMYAFSHIINCPDIPSDTSVRTVCQQSWHWMQMTPSLVLPRRAGWAGLTVPGVKKHLDRKRNFQGWLMLWGWIITNMLQEISFFLHGGSQSDSALWGEWDFWELPTSSQTWTPLLRVKPGKLETKSFSPCLLPAGSLSYFRVRPQPLHKDRVRGNLHSTERACWSNPVSSPH